MFHKQCEKPISETTSPLITIELYNAQRFGIKTAQQEVFAKNLQILNQKQQLDFHLFVNYTSF